MKGFGWRAGYEKGYDMGTYAPNSTMQKRIQRDTMESERYREHTGQGALDFHRKMARNLFAMSPAILEER